MADVWSWTPQPRIIPQSSALADRFRKQLRFEGHDCPACKGWHADWWQSTPPPGCRRR